MSDDAHDELALEAARREARAKEGGGPARSARHKRLGRLLLRERIDALVDPGTFVELGQHVVHRHADASEALAANQHPGDGVVCGMATIDGAPAAVWGHDPTVLRGALGIAASRKVTKLLDLAYDRRAAVVTLADSDGVRVEEGVDAIDAYGEIIRRVIRLRGHAPQITLACGLCVGAAAYAAALGDWVGMVDGQSYMFITGPKVTKVVTGEDVELADLGGPAMHAKHTGQCHAVLPTEAEGIAWVRRVLSYAYTHNEGTGDDVERAVPELTTIIPTADRRAYDMRKVVAALADHGSTLELSPRFAPNLLTTLARLGGRSVAIVASQPMVLAGCLDADASRKGAHFVRWSSARGLPIVTLVDVPGYLPGKKQEQGGIIPFGAELLAAYGEARVPRVCLVVRKSFGGASVLSFSADVRLGLPTARVGPMGADAALEVALGPEVDAGPEAQAARAQKRAAWLARHDHAWAPAEAGYVDRVVQNADARREIIRAVRALDVPGKGAPLG